MWNNNIHSINWPIYITDQTFKPILGGLYDRVVQSLYAFEVLLTPHTLKIKTSFIV